MRKNMSFTRLLSMLLCICFIFISLFLISYIIKESDHHCSNENCPICDCILEAEKMLKYMFCFISKSYCSIIVFLKYITCPLIISLIIKITTPITLKVKMIN